MRAELTPREKEIYSLILEGRSCREMALELKISINTVKKHRSAALQKSEYKNALAAHADSKKKHRPK